MALPDNTIITPVFQVNFPALFHPEVVKFSEDDTEVRIKYKVQALFSPDTDLSSLLTLAKTVSQERWPKGNPKMRSPFLDGNDSKYANYHGCTYMRFLSDYPPVVRDHNNNIIKDESEIYPGCYGRAIVKCVAYEKKFNSGISFFLLAFQKTADGTPIMGIPEADLIFDNSFAKKDDFGLGSFLGSDEDIPF